MEPAAEKLLKRCRERISRFAIPTSLSNRPELMFPCYQCDALFTKKSDMTFHAETVHTPVNQDEPTKPKITKNLCKHCHEPFSSTVCLQQHIKQEHSTFICEICDRTFDYRYKLDHHKEVHSSTKMFSCESCDRRYSSRESLRDHKRYHKDPKFECEKCRKRFHKKTQVLDHMSVHYTLEFPCEFKRCLRSFRLRNQLVGHHKLMHSASM